jgi:hypothetical protein
MYPFVGVPLFEGFIGCTSNLGQDIKVGECGLTLESEELSKFIKLGGRKSTNAEVASQDYTLNKYPRLCLAQFQESQ